MTNVPVFLSSDNNYAPFVATTIASICDNTDSFIEFYVLDGGISQENIKKIKCLNKQFKNFNLEFIKIDLSKYFKKLVTTDTFSSPIMYARLLIPEIKPDIKRAIYTDPDIIAMDDITQMFNENLEGYALGACWEKFAENTLNIERKQRLKLDKNHKYFASGNLLLDCEKWRKEKIVDLLLNIVNNSTVDVKYPDQDILNLYFQNNYKILDKRYCYLTCYEKSTSQVIRHFTEYPKPWLADFYLDNKKPKPIYNRELFWKYAKMTSFYKDLLKFKKDFLSQKFIYERFDAIVNKIDKVVYDC